MKTLMFDFFVSFSNRPHSKNSPIKQNFRIRRLQILFYGSIFLIFSLNCIERVIASSPAQEQPQTTKLKPASISTYFVSPTGSNSNPGSASKPFLTAAYAVSKTNPGDTVIFENGTYTYTPGNFFAILSRSGTSSAYITYKARNRGKAILDGQNNSAIAAFSIATGTSYINISGFEIKGMENVGIEVRDGVSHINFSDLNIHDIGRRITQIGDGSGITIGKSNYMVIERCLFHDLGAYAPGEKGARYPAGYIGYQTLYHGIYIDGTSYVTVKNNVFYNIKGGFGVQIYSRKGDPSSNVDIINNTFENGNPYQAAGHIILCNNLSNSLIANNIFKDHHSYAIYTLDFGYTYSSITITKNITSGGNGRVHGGSAEGTAISNNYNSTDPLFTNEEIHDYSLQRNSPANKTGYDTGLFTNYLNNLRKVINIGAY